MSSSSIKKISPINKIFVAPNWLVFYPKILPIKILMKLYHYVHLPYAALIIYIKPYLCTRLLSLTASRALLLSVDSVLFLWRSFLSFTSHILESYANNCIQIEKSNSTEDIYRSVIE